MANIISTLPPPVVMLYPLTAEQLCEAVRNTGFLDYKPSDFSKELCCEFIRVQPDVPSQHGGVQAKYTYRYYNDNEGMWETAHLYVWVGSDGKLHADW